MPEIIRLGDPTSHNGKVLEGSPADICQGKPIAYIGHKVYCPKCKGNFPIVEGAQTTTFYGKGVALAGMKTSCGAVLIATQFTDTVEYGGSSPAAAAAKPAASAAAAAAQDQTASAAAAKAATPEAVQAYDIQFRAMNLKTRKIIANTPYRITLDNGEQFTGVTDASGLTEKVASDSPRKATLEIPYYDHCDTDPTVQSNTCSC